MYNMLKLAAAALGASLLLATAVGAAAANNLSVDDSDVTIKWSSLTFSPDIGGEISCPVTLLETFHERTFAKVQGRLIGVINRAELGTSCTGGDATILTETLPWHTTYAFFSGTLPSIPLLALNLIRASFAIENGLAECRAITESGEPSIGNATLNTRTGAIVGFEPTEAVIDFTDTTGSLCDIFDVDGTLSGAGEVEDTEGNAVIVRLI